jgi:hypothetical protein
MKKRDLGNKLLEISKELPVVTVTGPRQSGKTTLCRELFADKPYINLEAPDEREFARTDPRTFLSQFKDGAVLDEIQRVPDLLSYIQTAVDEHDKPGQYILTGSQNLLLLSSISQSLAGRTALATLYPFTLKRLTGTPAPHGPKLPCAGSTPVLSKPNRRPMKCFLSISPLTSKRMSATFCASRTRLVSIPSSGSARDARDRF